MNLTLAREELASAYDAAGVPALAYTPPTLVPPLVTVLPGSSWITPNRVGCLDAELELNVTAYVTLIDPVQALAALEDLVEQVLVATPTGVVIDSVDQPRVDSTSSQGELLVADITIRAQIRS